MGASGLFGRPAGARIQRISQAIFLIMCHIEGISTYLQGIFHVIRPRIA
jgi:hypothetical protein